MVGTLAVEIHADHCPHPSTLCGCGPERVLDQGRVEIPGGSLAVDEPGLGPDVRDGVGGGDEGE